MSFKQLISPFICVPIIGLCAVSLFLIATTAPDLFWTQAVFFFLGLIILLFFSSIDFRIWLKFKNFIYIVAVLILLISFLGPSVRGSTRWIDLGFFRLQPSELIKPFLIIIMAAFLSENPVTNLSSLLRPVFLLFPFIFLIFKQPDLGNVLVYLSILISLIILSGISWSLFTFSFLSLTGLLPFFWFILKDYQKQRLLSFLNPQQDPIGAGYNSLQAVIAIGSGKIMGMGLGRGTQSRLMFLPEYHTDFVFASLGEVLGFLGGALVIILYLLLLYKILNIAINTENIFGKFIILGVFAQLFSQIFINLGMNLGLLPITGITLPLISYGGSSIISTFIGLGLVISIANYHKKTPLVIR